MSDNPFKASTKKQPKKLFSDDDIVRWIKASRNPKKSDICAMFVGHPKTGKTGCALDCFTDEEKESGLKVIAIELNSDNGCELNRKQYHQGENIVVLNPREYSQDESGDWQPDYVRTMAKIKSLIQYIAHNTDDVGAIVFDGLDIFLSEICESQMRIDEHIDISGGVSQRYWKKRNDYYFKIVNMILDIDVDKYFITHFAVRRTDENGNFDDDRTVSKVDERFVYACQKTTADKMHQIVELHDKTRIVNGKPQIELTATIVSDRRNLASHMQTITIAKSEGDEIVWNGRAILKR